MNSPSTDETRDACRRLLGAPRLRAAVCHYCGVRAETGGPITLAVRGWDLTPPPRGGRYWRCPVCRAEDEGPREVFVIPVRVEPATERLHPAQVAFALGYVVTALVTLLCLVWAFWR